MSLRTFFMPSFLTKRKSCREKNPMLWIFSCFAVRPPEGLAYPLFFLRWFCWWCFVPSSSVDFMMVPLSCPFKNVCLIFPTVPKWPNPISSPWDRRFLKSTRFPFFSCDFFFLTSNLETPVCEWLSWWGWPYPALSFEHHIPHLVSEVTAYWLFCLWAWD